MTSLISIIILVILLLYSIIIHEISHGYTAYKLGDPTAKYSGRLTLNPIAHIDPIGTILIPVILIISHSSILFGWAKPVPINPYSFKNPQKDMAWVGLAGPASNLCIAFLLSLIVKILPFSYLSYILTQAAVINIVLSVINLIPIPPLDGSRIVSGMLSREMAYQYSKIEPYGIILAYIFIVVFFRALILPIVGVIASLLSLNFL